MPHEAAQHEARDGQADVGAEARIREIGQHG